MGCGQHPLVLGIPLGAVSMARVIADQLGGGLDVVLVRKLRAPQQPELVIGSIDESGLTYLADYARAYGGSATYIASEKQAQVDDDEVIKVLQGTLKPTH